MTIPLEVTVALISLTSAATVVILEHLVVRLLNERRSDQRALVGQRLEKAYVPLEHLVLALLQAPDGDHVRTIRAEIEAVLRPYSHLLTEESVAALYTLLEDQNLGACLLRHSFTAEIAALKQQYYRLWHSRRDLILPPFAATTPAIHQQKR